MLTNRIMDIVLVTLALLGGILLLLIVFQPSNIEVNEGVKTGYMRIGAWTGFLLSLPVAFYLVKVDPSIGESRFGKIMHQVGVWGSRACIVFLVYMLFAVGSYLLPHHIVNLVAFEKVREDVTYMGYRLSSVPTSPLFDPNRTYWNNEFLVVRKKDGTQIPLMIRNWYGTNKLRYDDVVQLLRSDGEKMQLVGRRHALGVVYDELRMAGSTTK